MFAFFFGILSLAFDLYLPFAIGIYANICNQKLNGWISDDDYNTKLQEIELMILIFLGTSALCDSISAYLIKGAAAKISKEMRYDLYICYHQKCG